MLRLRERKRIPPNVPPSPNDLVIARKESSEFTDEEGKRRVTSKQQFVHFHFRKACVLMKNPDFRGAYIQVTEEVRKNMSEDHFVHLREEFGIFT